jgi:hypothetical protein
MSKLTQEELDRIKTESLRVYCSGVCHSIRDAYALTINGYSLAELIDAAEFQGETSYTLQTIVTLAHKYGIALSVESDLVSSRKEFCEAIEKRIMPPGMEWPRFEDGEPFKFGDEVSLNNRCGKVNSVKFYPNRNRSIKAVDEDGNWGFVLIGEGEFIKRPEPKQDTLQDVIDDLYKTLPSMDAERNITVPASTIDRLKAIQERMGGEGEFIKRPEPKQDTLQDVIDDLYKTLPSMDAERNITVPASTIDRLKAIQERMGGEGESKADSPVEIPERKTCPHCGSSHYRCPYCGCEIDDPEWWETYDECTHEYEAQCPECDRRFKVSVELEPVFSVQIPRELEECYKCCAFEPDMDGYCGYTKLGYHDQEHCPLGYEKVTPTAL